MVKCSIQIFLSVSLLIATMVNLASGQTYPVKPVRMLVGFSPGGGVDFMARSVSPRLAQAFGQQFVVDNRSGANGMIAADITEKSPPDGHTLLVAPGNYAFASAMEKLPLDMTTAFAAVGQMVDSPLLVVVHPSLPVKSIKDLIALARSQPNSLAYGSGGVGGAGHMATELFKSMAKVNLRHIPFKGVGPALTDAIAGHVPVCFCTLPTTLPQARAGRLRALAVTTSNRTSAAPDIPTVAEAGVSGYEMSQWYGILAPAGTPTAILGRLSTEINNALAQPELRASLVAAGADPVKSSPQEFGLFFKQEIEKWTRIVKVAGIRPE
ncbi:MAG TPA: tripartite tricarboxylate transporter substrate binding protein [Burkholderiales bacterium]|nr:tripartite tricarboxylate transporter substrate binding protein [Burkholderiales bacterium]